MTRETKRVVTVISVFTLFYGSGVITHYSGHPQIGGGIVMISCIVLVLWGFGFAAAHTQD